MKYVFKFLKNYKTELFAGPFFKLLEAIFELIVPIVMANIIDKGIGESNTLYIFKSGAILVLLAVLGLCCAFICQFFAAKCAYGFGTDMRGALYKHINKFSHTELDKFGTSQLTTRITNDSNMVQTGVNMFIRLAVRAPFLIIGAMIMSFSLNAKLALIFLIIVPVISFVLYSVMNFTIPRYKENQKKIDELSNKVGENIEGTRVIRAFARQKKEVDNFSEKSEDLCSSVIAVQKISSLLNPISTMIMNIGIFAIIVIGGNKINYGSLSQGELTAFINYMTQISLALVVLANLIITFTKAIASAKRIETVFDTEPSMSDGSLHFKTENTEKTPLVEFKNVSFTYPMAGAASLENLSFKIYKGQTIGIIGGTGSGKSTILNLISRYYDATNGQVLLNGENISDYSIHTLREKIGIVPQKSVLFKGTVRENLAFRKQNATDDELIKALEIAQGWDFVSKMPEGLDTQISQGGKNLSGGQRQRVAIARALVGNPDILIFDDSMSALDYATDLKLRKNIAKYCKDCTVIIISQRATSLKNADNILVMENGLASGFDTHDNLLKTNKTYREIFNSQIENS
jgi:ATP-binding cassette subfamily B protein